MPFEVFLFRNISRLDLPLGCEHSVCPFSLPPCPSPPPLSPAQPLLPLTATSGLTLFSLLPEVICPHPWGRGAALKMR